MAALPQQVAKMKQAFNIWSGTVDDGEIDQVEKLVTRGRAFTCCHGALQLLNNSQLHSKSKSGAGLRGQLGSIKAMLEKNATKYGDAVPKWLVERVNTAAEVSTT